MITLQIILWLSVLLIFHSYVAYPAIVFFLTKKTQRKYNTNNSDNVAIIMSLYNEENVIAQKLDSIINSNFPKNRMQVLIGSDNSNDNTNAIVSEYARQYDFIKFIPFSERQGKSNVINNLVNSANANILILTDANVIFDINTINEIIKPFENENIGLVDTYMKNTGLKKEGISIQEKSYILREVKIKNAEGLLWGTMMGPFGGCFAIRKKLYSPVPKNFLVDDFYICMQVLLSGNKALNNLDAIVYEDVSNNISEEFRRKIRIATGNFQNLKQFRSLLISPIKGMAFSFISHKVIRWITPVLMLIFYFSTIILAFYSHLYLIILIISNLLILASLIDFFLKKLNYNIKLLRFITHFLSMNLALFIGMIKSIKGVKSNVWKPTKRNQ